MKTPTPEETEELLSRFGQGAPKEQHDLLCLFSIYVTAFTDPVWNWLEIRALSDDDVDRGIAFRTLERTDSDRFGRVLMEWDWTWKREEDFWVNHYGSGALISGSFSTPFDQIAPRLAPWRLLEAARLRGGDPAEVRLAASIFGDVLIGRALTEPDPGSDLTVDLVEWSDYPSFYSFELRKEENATSDPFGALRAAGDIEAQRLAWRRAQETAQQRISEARAAGANLFLANLNAEDITPVWVHAREVFDRWLEGFEQITADFKRRVRLAEAAYVAICEGLLNHDPGRGAELYRAMRPILTIRYVGVGGVDELIHIPFRAKDSPSVAALREFLIELNQCSTDKALDELAFAAVYNGGGDWLAAQIEADQASRLTWRQKRAIVLSGSLSDNALPINDAWPTGPTRFSDEDLMRRAARRRADEAAARHWWRVFLLAQTVEEAYAAWILFLRTCDRGSLVWIHRDGEASNQDGAFFARKMVHAKINRSLIKHASEARDKNLEDTFLGMRTVHGVGPWGTDMAGRH